MFSSKSIRSFLPLFLLILVLVGCGSKANPNSTEEKTPQTIPTYTPTPNPQTAADPSQIQVQIASTPTAKLPTPTITPVPTPSYLDEFSKISESGLSLGLLFQNPQTSSSSWQKSVADQLRSYTILVDEFNQLDPPSDLAQYKDDFRFVGKACEQMFASRIDFATGNYRDAYAAITKVTGYSAWCIYTLQKINDLLSSPTYRSLTLPILDSDSYRITPFAGSTTEYQTKYFSISFPYPVERRETIISNSSEEEAEGIYLVLPFRVRNTSKVKRSLTIDGPDICIVNPDEMPGCDSSDVFATSAVYELKTGKYKFQAPISGDISSGDTAEGWLVFDIPKDMPLVLLQLYFSAFSGSSDDQVLARFELTDWIESSQTNLSNGTSAESASGLTSDVTATIIGDSVNLRSGPGTDSAVAGQAVKGDSFAIVGKNVTGDWYQLSGKDGAAVWVAAFLVEVRGDVQGVSVSP